MGKFLAIHKVTQLHMHGVYYQVQELGTPLDALGGTLPQANHLSLPSRKRFEGFYSFGSETQTKVLSVSYGTSVGRIVEVVVSGFTIFATDSSAPEFSEHMYFEGSHLCEIVKNENLSSTTEIRQHTLSSTTFTSSTRPIP